MAEEPNFKFKNLEPLTYLKTFNEMLDHYEKDPIRQPKQGELNLPKLSKFPLPEFYYNMEGIFDNPSKKKIKQDQQKHQKLQQILEQQFMKKHNLFMKKTINKILKDSEQTQQAFQKRKLQYRKPQSSRSSCITRLRSQPKLKHRAQLGTITKQMLNPETQFNNINNSFQAKNDIKNTNISKKPNVKSKVPEFTDYKPRNKQKVRQRGQHQMQTFLDTRKKFFSQKRLSRQSFNTSPRKQHSGRQLSDQEKKDLFMKQIIALQHKQNELQKRYGSNINSTITDFHIKVNKQIEKINNCKFW